MNLLARLFGKEAQRKRWLAKAPAGAMHDYLSVPLATSKDSCRDADIVALDLETTGLDPKKDKILSYGLVHLRRLSILLESSRHGLICVDEEIPEASAVIHRITDDLAASGQPLAEVLPILLNELKGRIMLVHYARIEQSFMDAACRDLYGVPFVIPTIDTLVLAQRLFEIRNHTIQAGNLRLFNLRHQYNLPQYQAHNALSDALATAELFLAMAAEMYPRQADFPLERFLTH